MACRADRLYVLVMFRCVSEVVVVFVAALAGSPYMAAIGTGQVVRVWQNLDVDQVVDPAARLLEVAVARFGVTTPRRRRGLRLIGLLASGVLGLTT